MPARRRRMSAGWPRRLIWIWAEKARENEVAEQQDSQYQIQPWRRGDRRGLQCGSDGRAAGTEYLVANDGLLLRIGGKAKVRNEPRHATCSKAQQAAPRGAESHLRTVTLLVGAILRTILVLAGVAALVLEGLAFLHDVDDVVQVDGEGFGDSLGGGHTAGELPSACA